MSYAPSRKARGKSQKIFLVACHNNKDYERCYDVMGTTGNVYTVRITNIPECSCPDYQSRNKRCKHIYFVLIRIMKLAGDEEDTVSYSNEELLQMFKKIPVITNNLMVAQNTQNKYKNLKDGCDKKNIKINQQPLDDCCPICLDDLTNGENVDYCKFSCGKNVHVFCFQMWCKKQQNESCIFCRSPWNTYKHKDKYINLT